jgi:hypothetical protein
VQDPRQHHCKVPLVRHPLSDRHVPPAAALHHGHLPQPGESKMQSLNVKAVGEGLQ